MNTFSENMMRIVTKYYRIAVGKKDMSTSGIGQWLLCVCVSLCVFSQE